MYVSTQKMGWLYLAWKTGSQLCCIIFRASSLLVKRVIEVNDSWQIRIENKIFILFLKIPVAIAVREEWKSKKYQDKIEWADDVKFRTIFTTHDNVNFHENNIKLREHAKKCSFHFFRLSWLKTIAFFPFFFSVQHKIKMKKMTGSWWKIFADYSILEKRHNGSVIAKMLCTEQIVS